MEFIGHLTSVFRAHPDKDAVVWRDEVYRYAWLDAAVSRWDERLDEWAVEPGSVVSLEADFSPDSIGLLLALIGRACIVVPLTRSVEMKKPEFRAIAQVETIIAIADGEPPAVSRTGGCVDHALLLRLREKGHPGLILFSSGSTGNSKAVVHDLAPLLEKFSVTRHTLRTIAFLLFDHIGGINTLLYSLSNAGCIVTVQERLPDVVCAAIAKHKVQLLPTSPTFINLLLVSEAYRRHDLSSVQLITYGTEVMPESTLKRFHELYPQIRLLQTYGLSEVGILRSVSRASDSLWVKIGGEGFETRVADGMLEIRAKSAMLGYLNAESPFTSDGWFKTGDAVDVDGEYFRILGRKSELINVGGEKVYPAEVESVIQTMPGVEDVAVTGELNPITGQIIAAKVKLRTAETVAQFRARMYAYCQERLPRFKIPQKVSLVSADIHGARFKKMRH
jgi:acyl-CoA synthetase (AMP-forming)/AMP-acid ligase II